MSYSPPRCLQEGGGLAPLGGRHPKRLLVRAPEPSCSRDLTRLSRRRASLPAALSSAPSVRHRGLLIDLGRSFYTPWVTHRASARRPRGGGCKQRAEKPDFTLCNTGRWRNELMPRCVRSHKTGCSSYTISPVNAYLCDRMLLRYSCIQNLRSDDIPAEYGRPMFGR